MGLKREPNRLPTPLFLFSLGFLAACGVGDRTKRRHTSVLVGKMARVLPSHFALFRERDENTLDGGQTCGS
jgi:hypothetical protein